MDALYKLTDQNMRTYGGHQWELNTPAPPLDGKGDLCGPGYYHFYTHPLLAILLNPIHAKIDNPRLFEARGKVEKTDHGLKVGVLTATLTKEIPLPKITVEQRVKFGILCAKKVYRDKCWNAWADNWLNGENRTKEAAWAARAATEAAAATAAAEAARAAAWAATAARAATEAAARAAAWAATAAAAVDLIALAEEACR